MTAGVAIFALASVAALCGRFYWMFELVTHFRLQLAIGSILLAILAVALRMPGSATLASILAVANLSYIFSYVVPGAGVAQAAPSSFRILSANVSVRNGRYSAVHDLIRELRPDIVGLAEVNRRWIESLSQFAGEYPYQILRPQEGAYGLAVLSRIPLRELQQSPHVQDEFQTAVLGDLEVGGRAITLVFTHLRAPTSARTAKLRNQQLRNLPRLFGAGSDHERILLGDLNITPWSPFYGVLEAQTGLANAARGKGYRATWPSQAAILGIPIDHCLLSEGLKVETIRTGPDIGSDHLPLIVDIGIVATGRN